MMAEHGCRGQQYRRRPKAKYRSQGLPPSDPAEAYTDLQEATTGSARSRRHRGQVRVSDLGVTGIAPGYQWLTLLVAAEADCLAVDSSRWKTYEMSIGMSSMERTFRTT